MKIWQGITFLVTIVIVAQTKQSDIIPDRKYAFVYKYFLNL